MIMIGTLVFCIGLCVGSFLNVCIRRIPRGESLNKPRSRCPHCSHPIAAYDNIPLVSYCLLAGRCRHCRWRIPWRYPAVELLCAVLFLGLWLRWGPQWPWLVAVSAASAALVVVAFIDWDTFLIPDVLSLGLLVVGLLAAPFNPYFEGGIAGKISASLIGAAAGFAICWGTAALGSAVFKKDAMGGGDIKLMAAIGAWSGVLGAFDSLVVASFFGSIYGVWLIVRGKIKRQDPIPFGPFLSAAAIFGFFYLLPFGFPFF